jgi:hypothetical protein
MNRLLTLLGAVGLFIFLTPSLTLTAKSTTIPAKTSAMECDGELLTLNVSCEGADDGILVLNIISGVEPFTYTWSNGADETFDVLIELAPGDYSVTVTDAEGCTLEFSSTVTEPNLFYANASADNESSAGANNGSATANPVGGTSPYTYQWSDSGNSTTATVNNLAVGEYTVTVTDDNDCTSIQTVKVNAFGCTVTATNTIAQISCFGECDGQTGVLFGNGSGPYSLEWSNGSTSSNISGLCEGIYSVTVTDSNGCTNQSYSQINEPALLEVDLVSLIDIGCFGENTGSVEVQAIGGKTPYNYAWSTGSTQSSINGLAIGSYSVTITDGGACSAIRSFDITQAPLLELSVANTNPVDCSGSATGQATLSATGGTGSYSFDWSNGSEGISLDNLSAGNYTITVTDESNCTAEVDVTITEPDALVITLTGKEDVSCFGANDGSASVTVAGGISDYQYAWSNGTSGTSVSGLAPGTYTLIVTDANNCTEETSIVITEPDVLNVSLQDLETVSCFGFSNGTIEVSTTGGSMPMNMSWSNGDTGSSIDNLGPGNYTVTVTDGNGCTDELSATMSEPEVLAVTAVATDVECPELNEGSIAATVTGGTGDYSYLWSNGSNVNPIFALVGGDYTLTVTDDNNCIETIDIAVGSTDTEAPVAIASDVALFLGSNGLVSLTPGQVDNGSSDNCSISSFELSKDEFDCNDVGQNIVLFVVADATGNSSFVEISVLVSDVISPELTCPDNITLPFCEAEYDYAAPVVIDNCSSVGSPVLLEGIASGGTFPEGLTTVSYSFTDAGNNSTICSFEVTILSELVVDYSVQPVSCFDGVNGVISVAATGATPDYTYTWENGFDGPEGNGLPAGIYNLTVTESNGCEVPLSVEILEPNPLTLSIDVLNEMDAEGNGAIDITPTGGIAPFTFQWFVNDTLHSEMEDITDLSAGDYYLIFTDVNGCDFISDAITIDNIVGVNDVLSEEGMQISPNPSNGLMTVEIKAELDNKARLLVWDILGQQILMEKEINSSQKEFPIDLSYLNNGVYFIQLKTNNGDINKKIIINR